MLQINESERFLSSSQNNSSHLFYPTIENKTDNILNKAIRNNNNKKRSRPTSTTTKKVDISPKLQFSNNAVEVRPVLPASHLLNIKIENATDKLLEKAIKRPKVVPPPRAPTPPNAASHLEYLNTTTPAFLNFPNKSNYDKSKKETFINSTSKRYRKSSPQKSYGKWQKPNKEHFKNAITYTDNIRKTSTPCIMGLVRAKEEFTMTSQHFYNVQPEITDNAAEAKWNEDIEKESNNCLVSYPNNCEKPSRNPENFKMKENFSNSPAVCGSEYDLQGSECVEKECGSVPANSTSTGSYPDCGFECGSGYKQRGSDECVGINCGSVPDLYNPPANSTPNGSYPDCSFECIPGYEQEGSMLCVGKACEVGSTTTDEPHKRQIPANSTITGSYPDCGFECGSLYIGSECEYLKEINVEHVLDLRTLSGGGKIVDFLIVAGGGGGGETYGGGNAGEVIVGRGFRLENKKYYIRVGNGGDVGEKGKNSWIRDDDNFLFIAEGGKASNNDNSRVFEGIGSNYFDDITTMQNEERGRYYVLNGKRYPNIIKHQTNQGRNAGGGGGAASPGQDGESEGFGGLGVRNDFDGNVSWYAHGGNKNRQSNDKKWETTYWSNDKADTTGSIIVGLDDSADIIKGSGGNVGTAGNNGYVVIRDTDEVLGSPPCDEADEECRLEDLECSTDILTVDGVRPYTAVMTTTGSIIIPEQILDSELTVQNNISVHPPEMVTDNEKYALKKLSETNVVMGQGMEINVIALLAEMAENSTIDYKSNENLWGISKIQLTNFFEFGTNYCDTEFVSNGEYYIVPDLTSYSRDMFYLVGVNEEISDERSAYEEVNNFLNETGSGANISGPLVLSEQCWEITILDGSSSWGSTTFTSDDFYIRTGGRYVLKEDPSSWYEIQQKMLDSYSSDKSQQKLEFKTIMATKLLNKLINEKTCNGSINYPKTTNEWKNIIDAFTEELQAILIRGGDAQYNIGNLTNYMVKNYNELLINVAQKFLPDTIAYSYFNKAFIAGVWYEKTVTSGLEKNIEIANYLKEHFFAKKTEIGSDASGNPVYEYGVNWDTFPQDCNAIDINSLGSLGSIGSFGAIEDVILYGDNVGSGGRAITEFITAVCQAKKKMDSWVGGYQDFNKLPPLYDVMIMLEDAFKDFRDIIASTEEALRVVLVLPEIDYDREVINARESVERKLKNLYGDFQVFTMDTKTTQGPPGCDQQTTLPPVKFNSKKYYGGLELEILETRYEDLSSYYSTCTVQPQTEVVNGTEKIAGKFITIEELVGTPIPIPVERTEFRKDRGNYMRRKNNNGNERWAFYPLNLNKLTLSHIWEDISGVTGDERNNLWNGSAVMTPDYFEKELDDISGAAREKAVEIADSCLSGSACFNLILLSQDIQSALTDPSGNYFGRVLGEVEGILNYYKYESPIIKEEAQYFIEEVFEEVKDETEAIFNDEIIRNIILDEMRTMIDNSSSSGSENWNKSYANLLDLAIEMRVAGDSELIIKGRIKRILKRTHILGTRVESEFSKSVLGLSCYLENKEPKYGSTNDKITETTIDPSGCTIKNRYDTTKKVVECCEAENVSECTKIYETTTVDRDSGSLIEKVCPSVTPSPTDFFSFENFTNESDDIYAYGNYSYDKLSDVYGLNIKNLKRTAFQSVVPSIHKLKQLEIEMEETKDSSGGSAYYGSLQKEYADLDNQIYDDISHVFSGLNSDTSIEYLKKHYKNFNDILVIINSGKSNLGSIDSSYSDYNVNIDNMNKEAADINKLLERIENKKKELENINNMSPRDRLRKLKLGYHNYYYDDAKQIISDIDTKLQNIEDTRAAIGSIENDTAHFISNFGSIINNCASLSGSGLLEERKNKCLQGLQTLLLSDTDAKIKASKYTETEIGSITEDISGFIANFNGFVETCITQGGSGSLEERQETCRSNLGNLSNDISAIYNIILGGAGFTQDIDELITNKNQKVTALETVKKSLDNFYFQSSTIPPADYIYEPRKKGKSNNKISKIFSDNNKPIFLLIVFCIVCPLVIWFLRTILRYII